MRRRLTAVSVALVSAALLGSCRFDEVPAMEQRPGPSAELKQEQASAFARLALKGISGSIPTSPATSSTTPATCKGPRALHPAFYGCFDWHSSVHGHWMLVRLLRLFPDLPEKQADPRRARRAPDGEEPPGRGRLLRPAEPPVVRADLRLGLAAEAGRGTARLGRRRRARRGRRTCSRWPTRSWPATWPSCRSRRIRSAPASIRTPRSAWRSPSITRGPWTTSRCAS